jgi:hypothetical protein
MALEPCPACARPVSQQARFCIHCRTPIIRSAGLDIQPGPFNRANIEKFSEAFRTTALKLTERGPSARLCLLLLIIATLLLAVVDLGGLSFRASSIMYLANAVLIYGVFTFPAWLAFLLMLRRRSFGLYGAMGVFLYWLFLAGYVYRGSDWRLDPFTSFLTFIMVSLSTWGMIVAFLEAANGKVIARVFSFITFFLFQVILLTVLLILTSS